MTCWGDYMRYLLHAINHKPQIVLWYELEITMGELWGEEVLRGCPTLYEYHGVICEQKFKFNNPKCHKVNEVYSEIIFGDAYLDRIITLH